MPFIIKQGEEKCSELQNTRWNSYLDTRTASDLYHNGDKSGASLSLAKSINLFVIKRLDRDILSIAKDRGFIVLYMILPN